MARVVAKEKEGLAASTPLLIMAVDKRKSKGGKSGTVHESNDTESKDSMAAEKVSRDTNCRPN